MCDTINQSITSVRNFVTTYTDAAYKIVQDAANYCGRKFEDFTVAVFGDTAAARIAQKIVYSLPFAIAHLLLPAYVQVPLLLAFAALHVGYKLVGEKDTLPLSQNLYQNLLTGVGTAWLYTALKETVNLAMRVKRASVIGAVCDLFIAQFFYWASNKVAEKFNKPANQPPLLPVTRTPGEGSTGSTPVVLPQTLAPTTVVRERTDVLAASVVTPSTVTA